MTTVTHLEQPQPPSAPRVAESDPTDRLIAVGGAVRDPVELLDYRTQRRLIPAAAAAPGPYLAFESRAGLYLFPLALGTTSVGRALGADVRVDEAGVSRRHVTITRDREAARLLDDRSLHGTWVNGERAMSTILRHGDLIEIGRLVARFLVL